MLDADRFLPPPDWYLDNVVRKDVVRKDEQRDWDRYWDDLHHRLQAGEPCEHLAAGQGFVLTHAQARALGVTDPVLRRLTYRSAWLQPHRGVLAPFALPQPGSPAENAVTQRRRHALTACATALTRPRQVISGRSAAVLRGLPTMRVPALPELTVGPTGRPGQHRGSQLWAASLDADEITTWFGAPITTVARTVVDCARHDRADGLMAADAALHDGLVTARELEQALATATGWPFVRRARAVLAHADGRAESPLESYTRLRIIDAGLPVPDLQVWIFDHERHRRYRVDGLWEEQRLVLEMDGRVKYADENANWEEKRRHLALDRLGYDVVRVIWEDVLRYWPETEMRLRGHLSRRRPRAVPAVASERLPPPPLPSGSRRRPRALHAR